VSAPAEEIDWAEAVRAERRREWWTWPFLIAFFLGMVLVRRGFGLWSGAAGWLALAIYLVFFGVLITVSLLSRRLRERNATAYRLRAAVRRHVDPGPELRARADRMARYVASLGWVAWAFVLGPVGMTIGGRWDHPVPTAVGTVLLLGAAGSWSLWWLRWRAEGRRWLADPPGPPRELPPVTWVERWTTCRRVRWIVLAVLVVGIGGGLLVVLLH
jgi:hypothetical protein